MSSDTQPWGPARAQLAAWASLAVVNALAIAFLLPASGSVGLRVRLLHHAYDAGHLLLLGVISAAVAWAWSRWVPPWRWLGAAALWMLAFALALLLLRDDFQQMLTRTARVAAYAAICMGVASLPPLGWFVGRRLAHPGWRWVPIALGVAIAFGNHRLLVSGNPGLHSFAAWMAALLIAGALSTRACRSSPGRRRLAGAGAFGIAAIAGAGSVALPPSRAVSRELVRTPGSVLAPHIAPAFPLKAPRAAPVATILPVECEDLTGPWKRMTNLTGFSGAAYSSADATRRVAKGELKGQVQIDRAGRYTIWARGYQGGKENRSFSLRIADQALPPTHGAPAGGGFLWQRAGALDLPAGPIEIRVADAGKGKEACDLILLALDPSYDPSVDDTRWPVLDRERARKMLHEEFKARAKRYAERVPRPASPSDWNRRADELRPRLLRALGLDPLPPRTPLRARMLGAVQRDGYRIERVVFESRPEFPVTSNVYVPDGSGPFPLVVVAVGHWPSGKTDPIPSAVTHALAKRGFISMIYDPVGQGERAVSGNSHVESHGLNLSGHTNLTLMVWDTMRAIDYMLTRPDVDATKLALTGASGGGLNTLYTSAVDPRVQIAVPAVYVTQFEQFLATGVGHCSCSHVPGVASFTDMGEISALFAPRPQFYLDALGDSMFTTAGAKLAEKQARTVYDLLGAGGNLQLKSFDGRHGLERPMREALYGILEGRVRGNGADASITEPNFEPMPKDARELLCFPGGKVPASSRTARDFAREWAEQAVSRLPEPWELDLEGTRRRLGELLRLSSDHAPEFALLDEVTVDGVTAQKISIDSEPGISLPAHATLRFPDAPFVVIADGYAGFLSGKELLARSEAVRVNALYVGPRGMGETIWPLRERRVLTNNLLLGDPIAGQRAFDLIQAGKVARMLARPGARVGLLGMGDVALPALLAQAVERSFDALAAGPLASTFLDSFEAGMPQSDHISGILQVADVPHIAAMAIDRPLWLALSTSGHRKRYGAWADLLGRNATLVSRADPGAALEWLAEELAR
jgi:hypothetical protein